MLQPEPEPELQPAPELEQELVIEPEPPLPLGAAEPKVTTTTRAVIFPSRFTSPGTALDIEVYRELLDNADAGQCHGKAHLMPGSGLQPQERPPPSQLTLHIETLQPDNFVLSEHDCNGPLNAWMVNPEIGYPGCLPDAALSCVDVVLCKNRASVRLMQAYKAKYPDVARYRILNTGHTSTDLRARAFASTSRAALPDVVFYSPKTKQHMYLINPAVERGYASEGENLVVIYRLTAVEVAPETRYQRRRYVSKGEPRCAEIYTSTIDGLDQHLASYADPSRCSCLLRWRPLGSKTVGKDADLGEFKLLLPVMPLPGPEVSLSKPQHMYGFEDPRLFRFRGELWVICGFLGNGVFCNTSNESTITAVQNELDRYHQHLVIFPLESVSAHHQESGALLLHYDGRRQIEKNWMPFEHEDELFVVYSLSPHVILAVDTKTGLCSEVYATHSPSQYEVLEHGDPGNGAPPVRVTLSSGETVMIGAAHIRQIPKGRHWAGFDGIRSRTVRKTFFYAFESAPPFRIRSVGPLRTLMLSMQQQEQHTPGASVHLSALAEPLVEFLSSMCLIQAQQEVVLAWGVDDTFARIAIWPLKMLLSDLGLEQSKCQLPSQIPRSNDSDREDDGTGSMTYTRALHVGGKSQWKNTEAVLRCWTADWSHNRVLPHLTVVAWGPLLEHLQRCFSHWPWAHAGGKQKLTLPNVTVFIEKMQPEALHTEMAACGVHVCPSACEGFGHIINEARSLGAIIVTTAAAPMNELITDGVDGFTVPVTRSMALEANSLGAQMYSIQGEKDPIVSGLMAAMSKVAAMDEDACRKMGLKARLRFEAERRRFEDIFGRFGKAAIEHGRALLSTSDLHSVPFEADKYQYRTDCTYGDGMSKSIDEKKKPNMLAWTDYLRQQDIQSITLSEKCDADWDGLPARLLEVQKDDCVLDLCAGTNNGQSCYELLRAMHMRGGSSDGGDRSCSSKKTTGAKDSPVEDEYEAVASSAYIPTGVLVANDLDLRRLSAVIDRVRKRVPLLCGPLLATRCDAAAFPTLQSVDHHEPNVSREGTATGSDKDLQPQTDCQEERQYKQKFDRVLCCPPSSSCSIAAGLALHSKQLAILRRGLELLSSGGVLVYSVRSLDPVQGEAVVVAAIRSLRALPEWGEHGIQFLSVDSFLGRATAVPEMTGEGVEPCETVLRHEANDRNEKGSIQGTCQCQPALGDWGVAHPHYAGIMSTETNEGNPISMSEHNATDVDSLAGIDGARMLYRKFDDVPKDLRRSDLGSGTQSSATSAVPASLIRSTAFAPNHFGCQKADAELLSEMKTQCMRVDDRFIAILRKRTQEEIKASVSATYSSRRSSTRDGDGGGNCDIAARRNLNLTISGCSDTAADDFFASGAEVEVITPQGQRWPAVVKGRGKGKKYKDKYKVIFPDGCSFHCDPGQLVSRVNHDQLQTLSMTRREKVAARRPGTQMFDQVDTSGAQSIWRELCHTYGFTLEKDKARTATRRNEDSWTFPGDSLCIARFQKGKSTLYLVSRTIQNLRFRTNCRLVTAGIPCFTRVTTVACSVHDCNPSRNGSSWHWRPCHEAIGLIARCCADGFTGLLRLSLPQFAELLRERLLPRSALYSVTRDPRVDMCAEKWTEESEDSSTSSNAAQQQFGPAQLPRDGSVVVIPSSRISNTSRSIVIDDICHGYESTTAANIYTLAVVGDLTPTRLTISTSAETRASCLRALQLGQLGMRPQQE